MRIAFFHNLPSGGGKRSAYEWIKRMTQNHTVDLYLYDPHAEDFLDMQPFVRKTILVSEGETTGARGVGRLVSLNRVRLASEKIARLINAGNYDLAFIMQCKVSNSPFVLRHLRIPSLYFCHEPLTKSMEPQYRGKSQDGHFAPLKRLFLNRFVSIDRYNALKATLILTSSLYSRENIYRSFGVYPRLNYPGVDTEYFRPLNLQREPIILCVGTLNLAKGQDFVIKSVGTLSDRPRVKIIYNSNYCREDYRAQLAQLADSLGVSVSFDCLIADEDLVNAYNIASLTVFPSMLEPLGLVPLESMACATPVVGIAEAGIRETIQNNETGLLTERDPREFGQAIDALMKDKPMRERMGVLGRQRVLAHWTWAQSYEQLEKNMQMTLERYTENDMS